MLEKKVSFFTGQGLQLAAILETPADMPGGTQRLPGVVLCQGPGGAKGGVLIDVAKRLTAAGFVVLYFDYRGFGESQGRQRILLPLEQVEDIRCALTWLGQQPEVDTERLGLWGAATGGAHASYVAGTDNRVKCMVSVSGMGDCGRWFRTMRPYWQWQELLKS
ncbi:MAG: alpha/beta fold hydrolase, partial [Deltaproteobacteria bacterium]|nr:alpha/beta fold hydrolase [Deltaproteobacteria bacterium]